MFNLNALSVEQGLSPLLFGLKGRRDNGAGLMFSDLERVRTEDIVHLLFLENFNDSFLFLLVDDHLGVGVDLEQFFQAGGEGSKDRGAALLLALELGELNGDCGLGVGHLDQLPLEAVPDFCHLLDLGFYTGDYLFDSFGEES